jgi:ATP phosphoribosyltransferase regulatory subunit
MARWLLPENISDVLPAEAQTVEHVRRDLLDLYRRYGYELVIPPLLEHIESLLTGSGHDLDLSTLKMIDQGSGRTLGLRADFTPQVARIDSHILNRQGVVRLCYAGSCVHARAAHPLASREPLQIGAEIYGDPSLAADHEILELAVSTVARLGVPSVCIDMGHTGIVRALFQHYAVKANDQTAVVRALVTKDPGALREACASVGAEAASAFAQLLNLHGAATTTLTQAAACLPAVPVLVQAIADLRLLAAGAEASAAAAGLPDSQVRVSVDLADTHGFGYHTGLTFAAFVPGLPGALLRGGRYDDVGAAFGRARPATGFSLQDLREAAARVTPPRTCAIWAPSTDDQALHQLVRELRDQGHIVVRTQAAPDLPSTRQPGVALQVDRIIRLNNGQWQVTTLPV